MFLRQLVDEVNHLAHAETFQCVDFGKLDRLKLLQNETAAFAGVHSGIVHERIGRGQQARFVWRQPRAIHFGEAIVKGRLFALTSVISARTLNTAEIGERNVIAGIKPNSFAELRFSLGEIAQLVEKFPVLQQRLDAPLLFLEFANAKLGLRGRIARDEQSLRLFVLPLETSQLGMVRRKFRQLASNERGQLKIGTALSLHRLLQPHTYQPANGQLAFFLETLRKLGRHRDGLLVQLRRRLEIVALHLRGLRQKLTGNDCHLLPSQGLALGFLGCSLLRGKNRRIHFLYFLFTSGLGRAAEGLLLGGLTRDFIRCRRGGWSRNVLCPCGNGDQEPAATG